MSPKKIDLSQFKETTSSKNLLSEQKKSEPQRNIRFQVYLSEDEAELLHDRRGRSSASNFLRQIILEELSSKASTK